MKEMLRNIQSPYWLISVVVVGILTSIAAAYLKSFIDKLLDRFSQSARDRNQKLKEKRENLIVLLKADPHKQVILSNYELRYRIRGVLSLISILMSLMGILLVVYMKKDLLIPHHTFSFYFIKYIAPITLIISFSLFFQAFLTDYILAIKIRSIIKDIHDDLDLG
jgi:hypothetical protein